MILGDAMENPFGSFYQLLAVSFQLRLVGQGIPEAE
jgi:hypothetical protein